MRNDPRERVDDGKASGPGYRAPTVLVVDDTPDNLDLYEQVLEDEGFRVLTADGGAAALELAARNAPDLVLLDVQMPEMDGYEVLRRLRENRATRAIPVIFLTARYRDPDRVRDGLDLGAHDYLTKPVEDDVLVAKVRAVLRSRREDAERHAEALDALRAHKLAALGQLAGGVAHEINTPIQFLGDNLGFVADAFADLTGLVEALRSALERAGAWDEALLAKEQSIDLPYLLEEIPRAIAQAREGVARIASVTAAMRQFARPAHRTHEPVDANELVSTTLALAPEAWSQRAEIEVELGDGLPSVRGCPGDLQQALWQILANAVWAAGEAAGEGSAGRVRVWTAPRGAGVEVGVGDDGPGIAPELRERIFEPFFTTRDVGEGAGTGLALARAIIVDQHGGELLCESEPGGGATFRLVLPGERV